MAAIRDWSDTLSWDTDLPSWDNPWQAEEFGTGAWAETASASNTWTPEASTSGGWS